jgi:hypothetical protein
MIRFERDLIQKIERDRSLFEYTRGTIWWFGRALHFCPFHVIRSSYEGCDVVQWTGDWYCRIIVCKVDFEN